jgi:hypothetical protein
MNPIVAIACRHMFCLQTLDVFTIHDCRHRSSPRFEIRPRQCLLALAAGKTSELLN